MHLREPLAVSEVFVHTVRRQQWIGRAWLAAVATLCAVWFTVLPVDWAAWLQHAASLAVQPSADLRVVTLYALALPLVNGVFAVELGARLIAGERELGGLALLLAQPVSRRRLFFEKVLTLPLWLAAVILPVLVLGLLFVPFSRMDAAGVVLWFQGLVFAVLGCLAGAAAGKLRAARAAGGLCLILAAAALRLPDGPGWARVLRSFSPLSRGVDVHPLVSAVRPDEVWLWLTAVVVLAAIAGYLFEHRDLD